MGWKAINGKRYFYASVREGEQVRSVYIGAGELGTVAASLIEEDQREKLLRRSEQTEERETLQTLDKALDDLAETARRCADEVLVDLGYHLHRRSEWRLRRVKRDESAN